MATTADGDAAVVPAKYSPACYACIRSLKDRGVTTVVPSGYDDVPAFHSRFCDRSVTVPSPHDDLVAYRDALLSLAEMTGVRTILPVFEEDAYVLSKYRSDFADRVDLAVPPLAVLEQATDRLALCDTAKRAGVAVPETERLTDVADWTEPQVVKSRYNLLTPDVFEEYTESQSHVIEDLHYLEPGEAPDRSAVLDAMRHEPIVQEYVDASDQFVFGALCDHGTPATTFQHRQVRGETYAGGGGSYRESVAIGALETAGRSLLDALDWHGLACIEFRREAETGEFVLTELNPRVWRSMAVAVAAGADFPHHYWLLATGDPERIEPSYETGVGMHFSYGEWTYLKSVIRREYPTIDPPSVGETVRDIATSAIRNPRFDYLRADDPGPFVRGLIQSIR